MNKPIDVAILGATGAVGQRFIQLLDGHPTLRVRAVIASERSAGQCYGDAVNWVLDGAPPADVANLEVLPLDAEPATPLVFSALPATVARERELDLAAKGYVICSNASAFRMEPDVPLLIPEVNANHIQLVAVQREQRGWQGGALVTSPNCTSTPIVMALAPLRQFGISKVNVVSMQAISGAGHPGVSSLDIFDNVIPYIPGEEEKVQTETRKMLGTFAEDQVTPLDAIFSAQCNRVPVLDGHIVAVSVELTEQPTLDDIRAAWNMYRGDIPPLPSAPSQPVLIATEPDRPQPRRDRQAGKGMSAVVGRLRTCPILGYKFVVLAHNTVRGAAGGAILNAELLAAQGLL